MLTYIKTAKAGYDAVSFEFCRRRDGLCSGGGIDTGDVKMLEATDFSEKMIEQAKLGPQSSRLHYSMQDATELSYAPKTFDAVIISNALHILPAPEKALAEIRRVLKTDGILIAPIFTAAGSVCGRLKIRMMELSGLRVFHK